MTADAPTSEDAWPCVVCSEPAGPDARSDCYRCGQYFHLRLTTTASGPDCGDVWIDDEVLALQFACRNCLDQQAGLTAAGDDEPPMTEPPKPESTPKARKASAGASARDLARRIR